MHKEMSFLESFAPFIDKHAIVIDIGHAYTKCGFAGDPAPYAIIPTKLNADDDESLFNHDHNEIELREKLMEFLYKIYYKLLNSNSRERRLVLVESVLTSSSLRRIMADILFNSFQAISVSFLPSHLAPLYTLGINTALVIDCGYTDCQIMPIAEGQPMTGLCDFIDLGGRRLHAEIAAMLDKHCEVTVDNKRIRFSELSPKPALKEKVLEDIKLRCCFVTPMQRSRAYADECARAGVEHDAYGKVNFKLAADCDYPLENNLILHIPGYVRELTCDVLFTNRVDETLTLPHLILDTLVKCPIDLKKELAANIVLIGGTCMLAGFKHRLVDELNRLINHPDLAYSRLLAFKTFAFHQPAAFDNYTSWLGGSIFGSNEALDLYSIHGAKYKESQKLPDWFQVNYKSDMVQI